MFVEDIAGPVTTDEFGVPGDRFVACFGTLLWLAEEGYLRYDETIRMEAIDQAVLTGALLRCADDARRRTDRSLDDTLPASVRSERSTYIHRLRDALKSGNSAHGARDDDRHHGADGHAEQCSATDAIEQRVFVTADDR